MKKPLRIALTTGDVDGIGLEVTAKALARIKPQKEVQFYLWRSPHSSVRDLRLIDRYFKRVTVPDWPSALQTRPSSRKVILDIESKLPPAFWVENMAMCALSKSIDALVTAPLSKTEIHNSGFKDNGHTDILKRIAKKENVFMTFLGKRFNVVLLTGHTSIKKAYDQIDGELLGHCLELTHDLKKILSASQKAKPIGLVGCSPHAGEQGIIDKKEMTIYQPALDLFANKSHPVDGPLVPDVCFQKNHWGKYSFYIASYHDQGLIPFKMVHGANSGVQLSLGLPFLRTSVDHGTAKDIFGQNKAVSGSMENAIRIAIKILRNKPITW